MCFNSQSNATFLSHFPSKQNTTHQAIIQAMVQHDPLSAPSSAFSTGAMATTWRMSVSKALPMFWLVYEPSLSDEQLKRRRTKPWPRLRCERYVEKLPMLMPLAGSPDDQTPCPASEDPKILAERHKHLVIRTDLLPTSNTR
jgi:hypothetical protein